MDFARGRSVVSPRPVESKTASYYPLKRFKRAPWTRERRRERRRDRFREGKQRLESKVVAGPGVSTAHPLRCQPWQRLAADPLLSIPPACTPVLVRARLKIVHLQYRCQLTMGKGGRSDSPLAAAAAAAASDDEQVKPVWSSGVPFFPPSSRYWRIGGEWYDLEPFLDKHPGGAQC